MAGKFSVLPFCMDDSDDSDDSDSFDGLDYVLHVREEAAQLPSIMVADKNKLPPPLPIDFINWPVEETYYAESYMKLTAEKEEEQLQLFKNLRDKVFAVRNRLPRHRYRMDHDDYLVLRPWDSGCGLYREEINEEIFPHIHGIIYLTQAEIARRLENLVYDLNTGVVLTFERGAWLYGLLLFLRKNMLADTCNTLRNLARICKRIRDILTSPDDPEAAIANVVIAVVSCYFGQADLKDSY